MEAPRRGRRPIQRGTRRAWQAPTTAWAPHSSPTRALVRPPAASRAPRYHAGDDHGPHQAEADRGCAKVTASTTTKATTSVTRSAPTTKVVLPNGSGCDTHQPGAASPASARD